MSDAPILVLVGTKAQYIKTAPILVEMDRRGVHYRLVYTGQHSETFDLLEAAFGTRPADDVLVPRFEASTHANFARWTLAFWRAAATRLLRGEWRGAQVGLVHGDTASTLFTAMALRLAGVRVAHVEAGLRSTMLLEPFPEEIVRRIVSRLSRLHFAPDAAAAANLRGAAGVVLDTGGNTLRDAYLTAMERWADAPPIGGAGGYAVASIHRSENLSNRAAFELLMQEMMQAAESIPLRFVLHPATRERIRRTGWEARLRAQPGLQLLDRMDYPDFVRLLVGSRFLMTDGGSNQEEAAMMGLPTLLLRRATERPDGLGDNIVLSKLDRVCIRGFVAAHANATWPLRRVAGDSPSRLIVDALQRAVSADP
jgi:UDP-N-acetylglucosamine 2-epimerase (non-hydrolysing)